MIEKSWEEFFKRLDEIDFKDFDLIVGISSGGIIPASFIQQKLKIPMKIISINYRDEFHTPKYESAMILEETDFPLKEKRILLVDDVCKTGETINAAKQYLKGNEIETCFVNGKGDYYFFQSETCLNMPWRR